jgi:hypothetical protein
MAGRYYSQARLCTTNDGRSREVVGALVIVRRRTLLPIATILLR